MLVTVFTPVYNREKSIRDVYMSLCAQTCKDFEWLVINDGSTDRTDEILSNIVASHKELFPINYVKKENEGLNRTINRGLDMAQGKLFMRLDSDDTALPCAVERIKSNYHYIEKNERLCALVFYAIDHNERMVGYHPFDNPTICDFATFRDKYGADGDRAEITKVDVFRTNRFPEIPGEKFCAEGLMWNRMSKKYDAMYLNEPIYKKGCPDDSITADVYHHLKKNCISTTMYYQEIIQDERLSYRYRLLATIKYYRYAFYSHFPLINGIPWRYIVLGFPMGLLVVVYDKIKH